MVAVKLAERLWKERKVVQMTNPLLAKRRRQVKNSTDLVAPRLPVSRVRENARATTCRGTPPTEAGVSSALEVEADGMPTEVPTRKARSRNYPGTTGT